MMLKRDQKELLENLLLHDIRASERRRVHLLLLYDRGMRTSEIAREVDLSPSRVRYWKRAFLAKGMAIFPSLSYLPEVPEEAADLSLDSEGMKPEPEKQAISTQDQGTRAQDLVQQEQLPESTASPEPMTVETFRQKYHVDHRHVEHVLNLALGLFEILKPLHSLPNETIPILTGAVLLHDIASNDAGEPDTRRSSALILDQPLAGLSQDEHQTIAAIVGSLQGKLKFDVETALEFPALDQEHAFALIALLRLAIALDSSHSQSTQIEKLSQSPQAQYVVVKGPHASQDAQAAMREGKLWRKLFKHNLRVISVARAEEIFLVPGAIPFPETTKHPGLEPTDTVVEAARKILRHQFAEMLNHEEGTKLGEDIEELHDMRVPVRRMRVTFEIFGESFDAKQIKPHIKGLRAVGRALGRVRDLDVFMEKAERYLTSLPEEKHSGLDPLFRAWQDQREKRRVRMLTYLESDEYKSFLHKFNKFVNTPGDAVRKDARDYHVPHLVRHAAPIMINTRLGAVRAYDEILSAATIEQLHELRIEFKRLRYIVEFFREVLGEEAKLIIDEIKDVQDHLGDLNDADVACQILSDFLDEWESRQQNIPLNERENPEPIVAYLAARHAERHHLMTTFGETWRHFERPEFRRNLALAVAFL
jgi:CHAD domain-containing protein